MARKWVEVYNDPENQHFSPDEWKEIRKEYFVKFVVPQIEDESPAELWKEFNDHADNIEREKNVSEKHKIENYQEVLKAKQKKEPLDPNVMRESHLRNFIDEPMRYTEEDMKNPDVVNEIVEGIHSRIAVENFFKKAKEEGKTTDQALDELLKSKDKRRGALSAMKHGPGGTLTAMFLDTYRETPKETTEVEKIWGQYQPESLDEKIAYGATAGILDTPYYLAGGALGGPGGAFGLPAGLRAVLELKQRGLLPDYEVKDFLEGKPLPDDILENFGENVKYALSETLKGEAEGLAFHGAGKLTYSMGKKIASVKSYNRLRKAGLMDKGYAEYSNIQKTIGNLNPSKYIQEPITLAGEIGAVTGARSVLHDEPVTLEGIAETGGVLLGMKAGNKLIGKPAEYLRERQMRLRVAEEKPVEQKVATVEPEKKVGYREIENKPESFTPLYDVRTKRSSEKEIIRKLSPRDRNILRRIESPEKFARNENIDQATKVLLSEIERHGDAKKIWKDPSSLEVDITNNPAYAKIKGAEKYRQEVHRRVFNELEKKYNEDYQRIKADIAGQLNAKGEVLDVVQNFSTNKPITDEALLLGVKPTPKQSTDLNIKMAAESVSARLYMEAMADQRKHNQSGTDEAIRMFFKGNAELNGLEYGDPFKKVQVKEKQHIPIFEAELNAFNKLAEKKWEKGILDYKTQNFSRKIRIDTNEGVKRVLVDPANQVEYNSFIEVKRKHKAADDLFHGLKYHDRTQIQKWLLWRDKDGQETLKYMGESKQVELSPKQAKVAQQLLDIYNREIDLVNKMEDACGLKRTQKRDGYATLMRQFTLAEMFGVKASAITENMLEGVKIEPRKSPFTFGKERLHVNKRPVELDAKQILKRYLYESVTYRNLTPLINKTRLLLQASNMEGRNKHAYDYIKQWTDYMAGVRLSSLPVAVDKFLSIMNRNVGVAVISFNTKVIGSQFSAIKNTMVQTGIVNTFKNGFTALKSRKKIQQAYNESKAIRSRIMDVSMNEARLGITGRYNHFKDVVAEFGTLGIKYIDLWMAIGTWHSAMAHGKKLGLSGKRLNIYADDIVRSTQASASRVDLAPIQYTPGGKALTLFGTYGINHFNWLVREVFGKDNPNVSKKEVLKRVSKYIVLSGMINSMYQMFGSNPPDPAPIAVFIDEIQTMKEEDQVDFAKALLASSRELLEFAPVGGRAGNWGGKALPGATFTAFMELADAISGNRNAPALANIIGKFAGVPGTQEIYKRWQKRKKAREQKVDSRSGVKNKNLYRQKRIPGKEVKSTLDKILEYRIPR